MKLDFIYFSYCVIDFGLLWNFYVIFYCVFSRKYDSMWYLRGTLILNWWRKEKLLVVAIIIYATSVQGRKIFNFYNERDFCEPSLAARTCKVDRILKHFTGIYSIPKSFIVNNGIFSSFTSSFCFAIKKCYILWTSVYKGLKLYFLHNIVNQLSIVEKYLKID